MTADRHKDRQTLSPQYSARSPIAARANKCLLDARKDDVEPVGFGSARQQPRFAVDARIASVPRPPANRSAAKNVVGMTFSVSSAGTYDAIRDASLTCAQKRTQVGWI